MQEPDPNDRMDTDEDNDTESTNSSKRMDIIGQTPNKFNMSLDDYDFENISLRSHDDTFDSDAKIEELDKILSHIRSIKKLLFFRSIKKLLFNKEKLEFYLTNNSEEIIYILKNYELLEADSSTSQSSDSLFS